MECKDSSKSDPLTVNSRINRNILECKEERRYSNVLAFLVLIETYWNVKNITLSWDNLEVVVLIETYWNVKSETSVSRLSEHLGINRNILECKELLDSRKPHQGYVLIETYWNVKILFGNSSKNVTSINRNILECKVVCQQIFKNIFVVLIETYWNVKENPVWRFCLWGTSY